MDPIEALRIRGIGVGKKLVGDAQVGDVRAGKTFSNAQGNDKQGTLPVRSLVAQTITPGANNITKQAGIYDGDITIQGDQNLTAANIVSGKSIFGVIGNAPLKKFAKGTTGSVQVVTVTGLSFRPKTIVLQSQDNLQQLVYSSETGTVPNPTYSSENTRLRRQSDGTLTVNDNIPWTINNDGFSISTGAQLVWEWIAFE